MHIICKRLVEHWSLDIVPSESTSASGKLFAFISPFIVTVLKFKRIVQVNCNVHLPTYNSIISDLQVTTASSPTYNHIIVYVLSICIKAANPFVF